MKNSVIIGLSILLIVWMWLSWLLLSSGGINPKNVILLAISGIIVFVPLWKKYFKKSDDESQHK